MYGLRADFDGAFFLEKELEQVCFNSNQAIFSFSDAIKIVVGSSFAFAELESLSKVEQTSIPVQSSTSMLLIGKKVKDVKWNAEGTLTLFFEKGTLKIFDDSKQYESYEIHNGEKTTIV